MTHGSMPHKCMKPKGARGRAAVHAIGHTCKTGGFAYLERTQGKGAAIAAYQNKLAKHKHRAVPYKRH